MFKKPGNGRRALSVRYKCEKSRCKLIGQGERNTHGNSMSCALCIIKRTTRHLRVLLRQWLTLGEPFFKQAVLISLNLELWTQPNIGLDLSLRLPIEARDIFLIEPCHKQLKLQLSFTLL